MRVQVTDAMDAINGNVYLANDGPGVVIVVAMGAPTLVPEFQFGLDR